MTSIGYQSPISSGCGGGPGFDMLKGLGGRPVLGGGIRGYIAQQTIDTDNDATYAQTRFTLRDSWNTTYVTQLGNQKRVITPFRAVTNSGDILSRKNYSCGGSTQTFQSRPGMNGLRQRFGSVMSNCDNSGVPAAACNGKFVYDSSDYITYLKQKAVNKNYNDYSNGGDESSASQSAQRAIRRY